MSLFSEKMSLTCPFGHLGEKPVGVVRAYVQLDDGRYFSDWRRCSWTTPTLMKRWCVPSCTSSIRTSQGWRSVRSPAVLRPEQRWLPFLAPGLPLPVPVPVRVGEPSARFPRTWTVARWVDGEPADHVPITSPQAAGTLAGFQIGRAS